MKVSIKIPTYNGLDYLKNCSLKTVLIQTYTDYEVIISNDGEDSKTREYVESLKDFRIQYVEYPKKIYETEKERWATGGAKGQNIALDVAQGKYTTSLDQDDMWSPDFLENKVKFLEENPQIDFVYSQCLLSHLQIALGSEYKGGFKVNTIPHLTIMYRNKYNYLKYIEEGVDPADFDLWKRMYEIGVKMHFINKVDAIYNEKKDNFEYLHSLYEKFFNYSFLVEK